MNEYMLRMLISGIIEEIRNAMGCEYRVHMKDLSEAYHDSYYEFMVPVEPIKAVLDKLEQCLKDGDI